MESLVATGERTAPGLPDEEYWFARHEAAYAAIPDLLPGLIPGGRVADAGAGEGYGAAMLRNAGATVVALEYDVAACAHASRRYAGIGVVRANLAALPLASGSLDALVSAQVVEHLWNLPGFLRDCRRALRPGGALLVTTPHRLTFSPGLGRGDQPTNPFHVEEFDAEQVTALLADAGFDRVEVRGLDHGPRIARWEQAHGSIVTAQVAAVLSDHWPADLRDFVSTVTRDDFVVAECSPESADLIGIGWVAS
ncbi:MAG: class I SAM-dependent methyltransferase [Candidatus Nanopelagicales bacterium]